MAIAVSVAMAVVLFRFGYLQIVVADRYRTAAEENSIRLFPLLAPRGEIVDRNGEVLATSRPSFRASIVPRQLPQEVADREVVVNKLVKTLDLDPEWLTDRLVEAWDSPLTPIRLRGGLSANERAYLEERRQELPGLFFEAEPSRVYPFGDLAAHVLGYIGEISMEELQEFGGGYAPGDLVGKVGVERSYERFLKGMNGGLEVEVDALGNQVKLRGRRPPRPGQRLVLTIDRRLQARCEELLGDRVGTIMVMEARTGEILALATHPRFNPNWFAGGRITYGRWRRLISDPRRPLQNRATQGLYAPGSVFKIVTAAAALESGEVNEERTHECAGTFWIKTWPYKCWNEYGHGWLKMEDAIIRSCDIFFYKTGLALKVDLIAKYAERFGFGEPTGLDLPSEKGGHVPSRLWKERLFHLPWFPGNTVQLSIGQGYLLATPMQILQLAEMTALRGRAMRPHLLKRVEDGNGRALVEVTPQVSRRISIAASTWALIHRGLWGCVNFRSGTGYRAHLANISVAGKTSTIQNPHGEDHSAFLAFAPADDPEVVVATFVEHGMAGGFLGALLSNSALKCWDELRRGVYRAVAEGPSREGE